MYRMEGMLKKQNCVSSSNTAASRLGLHKSSQTISKIKPKIRIIHIFAPEIIKTDAENFRELVQRLTGKPTENCSSSSSSTTTTTKKRSSATSKPPAPLPAAKKKMEMRAERNIKGEEEEIWRGANSGGGFLGSFPDDHQFEYGFMAELNHEFPLFPLDACHMDAYGEPQIA